MEGRASLSLSLLINPSFCLSSLLLPSPFLNLIWEDYFIVGVNPLSFPLSKGLLSTLPTMRKVQDKPICSPLPSPPSLPSSFPPLFRIPSNIWSIRPSNGSQSRNTSMSGVSEWCAPCATTRDDVSQRTLLCKKWNKILGKEGGVVDGGRRKNFELWDEQWEGPMRPNIEEYRNELISITRNSAKQTIELLVK